MLFILLHERRLMHKIYFELDTIKGALINIRNVGTGDSSSSKNRAISLSHADFVGMVASNSSLLTGLAIPQSKDGASGTVSEGLCAARISWVSCI